MNRMSDEHNKGDIDVFVQTEKFQGDFGTMARASTRWSRAISR
jgi:methyl-accepting chemotaxis protein